MMLANDELRTVLVSIHVSLREAIEAVTFDNVLQTLRITHEAVGRALGRAPRIGVAGPQSARGRRRLDRARGNRGHRSRDRGGPGRRPAGGGPVRAGHRFHAGPRTPAVRPGEFDVVVAMYHDQGLIPVKYLGVEKGVNVTLGLPLVRTSPDHGTAFDLAGSGRADASSLIEAIRMARQLSRS